jgi:hypothetical protein
MKNWVNVNGVYADNLQAATVASILTRPDLPPPVTRALYLRQQRSLSSLAKYDALQRAVCNDGRLHGIVQPRGASRTGRYAGRIFQPQNLPRGAGENTEAIAGRVLAGNRDLLLGLGVGDVTNALSSMIRGAVVPSRPDHRLVVCDWSSIESRVLGWIANCTRVNETFAHGRDTYKDFAVEIFGVPYDEVTKPQRTYAKPPTLGCFAEGTEVLTTRGWVEIQNVTQHDKVYNGRRFVGCDGSHFMGVKKCVDLNGILVTPDHKILTMWGWVEAQSLLIEERLRRSATRLASGQLSGIRNWVGSEGTSSAAHVGWREHSTGAMLNEEKVSRAYRARTHGFAVTRSLCKKCLGWMSNTLSDYPIVTTPSVLERIQRTERQGMVNAASSMGSAVRRFLSRTSSRWMGGMTQSCTWTESITTATTSQEMFDSYLAQTINETKATTARSNMRVACTALKTSTEKLFRSIAARLPCVVNCVKEKLRQILSQGLIAAEVRTYDVINARSGERYMIRSPKGELYIVHNCGYRLGDDGLVAYAKSMGVTMLLADAKIVVKKYRAAYPEIPQFWYWLERATEQAMQGDVVTGNRMQMWRDADFLYIQLPSGRKLCYYQPEMRVEMMPWGKEKSQLSYMGQDSRTKQWMRIKTHGGHLTENIVQAIAYDILVYGLNRLQRLQYDIVMHVHDEIVIDCHESVAEKTLVVMREEMSRAMPWAKDLLLDAAGFITYRYRKD